MRSLRLAATLLDLMLASCTHASPAARANDEPQAYLFSYFTRNGEDGVHFGLEP